MKLAFVFPGQGSQSVGMLDAFADQPSVQEALAKADAVLGEPLSELIASGPAEALNATVNTQPALLVAEAALAGLWRSLEGPEPSFLAGHSLGEYAAHVVAGSLDFDAALRLVRVRAQLMQRAVEPGVGFMAAVLGLSDDVVEAVCKSSSTEGVCEPVNYNCPGQLVVAGEERVFTRFEAAAKEAGAKRVLRLAVSVPSHSSLMRGVVEPLARAILASDLRGARIPVYANVDARTKTAPEEISQALSLQVSRPVRWKQSVLAMCEAGVTDIVECGPGRVLAGLLRRTAPSVRVHGLSTVDAMRETIETLRNSD